MYGTSNFLNASIALGWSCRAGPPTRAKPVSETTACTNGLPVMGSLRYLQLQIFQSELNTNSWKDSKINHYIIIFKCYSKLTTGILNCQ